MAARLGNYELIRKIGSGGMAEVWMGRRATDAGATKAVAIKLMARRFADQPAYERMFAAEARLSMLLNHSNIVQVFDVGRVDETAFLVMEWVDGLNLAQILAFFRKQGGERLPPQVAGYVVGEILRALDYAHNLVHEGQPLRIVHRDVSPQNVLVSLSGEVKLTDFGVARLAMDETSGVHVKGKLRYMPREQLAGRSQHPGVDLYAAGAILHEMLSGEKFRAGANTEIELAAMAASPEIPRLPHDDVPWELEELRIALLQPDPQHRVQSAAEALRMLERWPGYRNAAAQLGAICRRIMGVEAPRSGLFDVREIPDPSRASGGPAPEAAPIDTLGPTQAAPRGDEEDTERRRPVSPLAVAAGLVLAVALVGSGAYLLSSHLLAENGAEPADDGLAPPQAQTVESSPAARPAAVRPVAAPAPPAAAGTVAPPGASAADDPAGAPSASADPPAKDATPRSTPAPSEATGGTARKRRTRGDAGGRSPPAPETAQPAAKKAPAPKQTVRFGLGGGVRLAYVRIDGRRTYVLEPFADVKLAPGSHRIEYRFAPDAPWKSGGRIRVEPGRSTRVRITRAGPRVERP